MILRRAALLALAWVISALAVVFPASAPQASAACSGVWVVVGGTARCTTSYATGLAALRGAGFAIQTVGSGFVCRIDGAPSTCTMNVPYWTYWHSTKRTDGTWGPWVYSNRGAGSYAPSKNVAEGWAYGNGSVTPSVKPPVTAPAAATSSTSKPTTTKPTTSKPRSTAPRTTAQATSAPSTTSRTTGSSTGGASASTTTASTSTKAPATTKDATVAASPTTTPGGSAAGVAPTPSATGPGTGTTPAPEAGAGSPVAVIATAGVLAVGGVALGAGWAVRRRR